MKWRAHLARPGLWIGAVAILVFLAGVVLFAPGPRYPSGEAVTMDAPKGGAYAIAVQLKQHGVIQSARVFWLAAELSGQGGALKAGEYRFQSGDSLWSVIRRIARGEVVRHRFSVPEGASAAAVRHLLERADFLSGPIPELREGELEPSTFYVPKGASRAVIIERMRTAEASLLAKLWAGRDRDLPFARPEDAVTLASIVERETAVPAERAHVAGVYINRLKAGMRLESDPSVIYGLTKGEPLGHPLRRSELETITPYNTYRVAGLPPTPIGNPGRACLEAVLHPASTRDMYFVADGSGGHAFAASFAGHLANVARWRQIQARRAER